MSAIPVVDNAENWAPLYLSTCAGASTCLGAAVVFCHPKDEGGRRHVSNATLAFSLSLAGSVMVTVSVISIAPAVFLHSNFVFPLLFFGFGALLFFCLHHIALPEPEEVLVEIISDSDGRQLKRDIEHGGATSQPTQEVRNAAASSKKKVSITTTRSRHSAIPSKSITESTEQNKPVLVPVPDAKAATSSNNFLAGIKGTDLNSPQQRRAWRASMLLFFSLLCHNFPEGLAVAASALESDKLGLTVTIGIMIHNIPEGIAIAVPCLAARPDQPWLAFVLASASGLAEPLGALVAMLLLRNVSKDTTENSDDTTALFCMENVLSCVAGIMVSVSLIHLFPEAKRYASQDRLPFQLGTILGAIVMVFTEMIVP